MKYSVQFCYEPEVESCWRAVWDELASKGFTAVMPTQGWRPHCTALIAWEGRPEELCAALAAFAASERALPVEFYRGIEAGGGYLGAVLVPTVALLGLHLRCHDALSPFLGPLQEERRVGRWRPHTTLGLEIDPARLGDALLCALAASRPTRATLASIGLVESMPVRQVAEYSFRS